MEGRRDEASAVNLSQRGIKAKTDENKWSGHRGAGVEKSNCDVSA